MKVGETYRFVQHDTRINTGAEDGIVFVVVSEIDNYRMSDADDTDRPGYLVLLLEGTFKEARPGTTFDISTRSFIACESVRFPAEE